MTEELKFPLEFKKCPVCGSERRVADILRDQEVEKKKINPHLLMAIQALNVAICDPTRPVLSSPVITAILDVCADCGCYYAKFVNVHDQVLQMKGGPPPGGQRPPQGRN
ncbi:MAG: hypothetical protein M0Q12_00885 [Synergistaceae bacterium]|nr:hypothetical protein [Synergistaceae bacterium]